MKPGLLARLRSHHLAGYAMVLLLVIGAVQMAASVLFYEAIDRQTIREDHARRVAELLIVSERVHNSDPALTTRIMATSHLDASIATAPTIPRPSGNREALDIMQHIVAWEPTLAERKLFLDMANANSGHRDLVGSMQMSDGKWLNFRSLDISAGWPIALRATAMTLLITLVCLGVGLFALRRLTKPLRQLSEAADALTHGTPAPLEESGPADLRNLARSFNDMQARITGLVSEQAQSFEAISHDLRTPLSRLKLASDFVEDSDIAKIVSSSAEEMETMLMSLQSFLRAQHQTSARETMDLVPAVRSLLAGFPAEVELVSPESAMTVTYREPLLLALHPLIENALLYGTRAKVKIMPEQEGWKIEIADDGPGIPNDCFERILDPFFRLDEARSRNTPGFGLGIPTAHRLLERFGGHLAFANATGGGLIVRVAIPT